MSDRSTEKGLNMKITLVYFTDDSTIKQACNDYWEIDYEKSNFLEKTEVKFLNTAKPSDEVKQTIRDKYGRFMPSDFPKQFCLAVVSDVDWARPCAQCGNTVEYENRTELRSGSSSLCHSCKAEVQAQRESKRQEEQRRREEELQHKKEVIQRECASPHNFCGNEENLHYADLDVLLYMLALIRGGAYEDFSKIKALDLFETPLSPTKKLDEEIFTGTTLKYSLVFHPDSPIESLIVEDGVITKYYHCRVFWHMPRLGDHVNNPAALSIALERFFREKRWIQLPTKLSKYIEDENDERDEETRIRKNKMKYRTQRTQEALDLWKKVALHECLEYLDICMEEHHFSFSPGQKTIQIIENGLETFSAAQMWNFIWSAVKNAAAYYQREYRNISKKQAANSVVGNIQKNFSRAIADGWQVKGYRRYESTMPRSFVSQVLYDVVLKVGEDGFNEKPSREAIELYMELDENLDTNETGE
jgi:hypothetical protein